MFSHRCWGIFGNVCLMATQKDKNNGKGYVLYVHIEVKLTPDRT